MRYFPYIYHNLKCRVPFFRHISYIGFVRRSYIDDSSVRGIQMYIKRRFFCVYQIFPACFFSRIKLNWTGLHKSISSRTEHESP